MNDILTPPEHKSELMARIVDIPLSTDADIFTTLPTIVNSADRVRSPRPPRLSRNSDSGHMHTCTTKCYELDGQIYVPHYVSAGVYVGPGGAPHTVEALLQRGAQWTFAELWPRYRVQTAKP